MAELKIESLPGSRDGIRILRLSGAFTLQGLFDFQTAFRAANDPVTIIDLTDVPYMDSAALGAIINVHTTSQRLNRQYALVGVSDRLKTLFNVGGVDGILAVSPSLEDAQQKFAASASQG